MNWNNLKDKWWFKYVGNIYFMVSLIFVVWITFFDNNSLLVHYDLNREVQKLENHKKQLQIKIAKDRAERKKLKNKEELERFGRENYYLKKEDEEIYLIEYQDSLKQQENE